MNISDEIDCKNWKMQNFSYCDVHSIRQGFRSMHTNIFVSSNICYICLKSRKYKMHSRLNRQELNWVRSWKAESKSETYLEKSGYIFAQGKLLGRINLIDTHCNDVLYPTETRFKTFIKVTCLRNRHHVKLSITSNDIAMFQLIPEYLCYCTMIS